MYKNGRDEGFNEFEITLLARELLCPSLTRRQMNYWFPLRSNAKRIQIAQKVHNVEDKDKAQFSETFIPPTTNLFTSALTNQVQTPSSKEIDRAKPPKIISYSDLIENKSPNSSIYFGEYNNTASYIQINYDARL